MAITDAAMLSEIQQLLLEQAVDGGVTWSEFWTAAEVLNAANDAQSQFLKDTAILVKRASINTVPNVLRHPLPSDWLLTYSVDYQRADGGFFELSRADGMQADLLNPDWQYNMARTNPQSYTDGELPTLQLQVMPAVDSPGILWVLYLYIGAALSNAGAVNLTVPDEFEPAIRWKTIETLLRKIGRALDIERADYCEVRYQEGVAAAKIMLEGWL